jgi:hypothetical protein
MEYNCLKCSHYWQATTDDVACCNCCDSGEFYDEMKKEEE